jgi:hypothetical protein
VDGADGLAKVAESRPTSSCPTGTCRGHRDRVPARAAAAATRSASASSPPSRPTPCGATAEQAGALFLIGKPFTAETFAEQLGAVLV